MQHSRFAADPFRLAPLLLGHIATAMLRRYALLGGRTGRETQTRDDLQAARSLRRRAAWERSRMWGAFLAHTAPREGGLLVRLPTGRTTGGVRRKRLAMRRSPLVWRLVGSMLPPLGACEEVQQPPAAPRVLVGEEVVEGGHDAVVIVSRPGCASSEEGLLFSSQGPLRRTIFLNRDGGTYLRGYDDASSNRLGIAPGMVTVPA